MKRAVAAHQNGRLAEAEAGYQQALRQHPGFPDALHLLGLVAYQQGDLMAALRHIEAATAARPDMALFRFNLGNVQRDAGHATAAADSFVIAWKLQPSLPGPATNLGNLYLSSGRVRDAAVWFDRALQVHTNDASAWNGLGSALRQLGQLAEAGAAFEKALAARPQMPEARVNRARLLLATAGPAVALAEVRAMLQAPDATRADPAILNECGTLCFEAQAYDDAIRIFRSVLSRCPDHVRARAGLANALRDSWQPEEAAREFARLAQMPNVDAAAWQNHLLSLCYVCEDPEVVRAQHARYAGLLPAGPPMAKRPATPKPPGAERLRVGYVSPDFRAHSCAFFLLPLLKHHDRARVEVFCYADLAGTHGADEVTQQFKLNAEHWRETTGLGDDAVREMIRADRIDVLLDLAGHTNGGRLPVFAQRAAPAQLSWLGYPQTSGLPTMDYRITDAVADPVGAPGADAACVETLLRLPDGFLCFAPLTSLPQASRRTGRSEAVCFGSFNNLSKVTPQVLMVWAQIVRESPGSQLCLKAPQLADQATAQRVLDFLGARGVSPEYVRLEARLPWGEHYALYEEIDIALDPFPYNGTTTTCEALWMGVPVITLAGRLHAGRVGASLLAQVGRSELVAGSVQKYVELAKGLAADGTRREAYRRDLRAAVQNSPLGDGPAFARKFETMLMSLPA